MEQPSAAEQRAVAVAKLKRAASLPRTVDGRRPPMHAGAVSEGERSQVEKVEESKLDDDSPPMSDVGAVIDRQEEENPEYEAEKEGSEAKAEDGKTEEEGAITSPPQTPLPFEEPTPKTKRRSRSRSRGRGSKDFKNKTRALQSPIPNPSTANDSSPDEDPNPPLTQFNGFTSPPLMSPIPSHFALLQQRIFASPEPGMMYPGTSPPTPMLPTLQDIQREALQRGLFRSNSAAARLIALQQLTAEAYDPMAAMHMPAQGKLGRNNTVAGGERADARRAMMRRLGERLREADEAQTSGGEEVPVAPPPKRKRRSRRGSTNRPAVVDDRELSSTTTPNTPIVPSSSLPLSLDGLPDPPRPPSGARSPTPNARSSSIERSREDTLAKLLGSPSTSYEYETAMERRGVVVEEDDMPERLSPPRPPFSNLPKTPVRGGDGRKPHTSDAPSSFLSDSPGIGVPVYLSDASDRQNEMFPSSPFATPLKEKSGVEDEEEVLFQMNGDMSQQLPWNDGYEREISWVADPGTSHSLHTERSADLLSVISVPDSRRIPINDDDEFDDEGPVVPVPVDTGSAEPAFDEEDEALSQPLYSRSQDSVHEHETSPEPVVLDEPPSPFSAVPMQVHPSTDSSFRVYPARLSVATPVHPELSSANSEYVDWDDRVIAPDNSGKKNGEGGTISKWDKVKNAFVRTGSNGGRRSRTNSIRERNPNTDSSVSRESGASLTSSSKADKGRFLVLTIRESSVNIQFPTADVLATLFPSSPGAVSPVPPPSTEHMHKYNDAKLFPFPGMKKLEEQMKRSAGQPFNASSPDIIFAPNSEDISPLSSTSSQTPQASPEFRRDRKLSHQASDSRLLPKFSAFNSPQALSSAPSTSSHPEYYNISPSSTNGTGWLNGKLPTNREGVKKWLTAKKIFSSQSSQPSYPSLQISPPIVDPRSKAASKKPSLSDLLKGRKENEIMADWEDISKTPTSTSGSTLLGRGSVKDGRESTVRDASIPQADTLPAMETPKDPVDIPSANSPNGEAQYALYPSRHDDPTVPLPSPPDLTSTTPDPMSSLDEYPIRSSTSTLSSDRSPAVMVQSQSSVVLERLDEMLNRGSKGPSEASLIDDPPRQLVWSSAVLQVANSNTVKDRFLFLFNDILVIAKPVLLDQDSLLDSTKPSPLDRKFMVKSVVQLRQLRFTADRDDPQTKAYSTSIANRHPLIRTFAVQFTKEPDHAISTFFEKTGTRDDAVVLGRVLFKSLDLDRARLGSYLSRRTSKVVLKAYIDGFGFSGIRLDRALRVFLQSLHIPASSRSSHSNPMDYMVDAFASRWYEANAGIVAYEKDLAVRVARALVQLNEVLHGGIVQEPGPLGPLKRNVTNRDFIDAFRRYDPRCLVSDALLDKMYTSIRREPLSQARNSATTTSPDFTITLKRPVPPRLTYRMQSEPIILRIPQPDPNLTIVLHGQDLIFDPPTLTFTRSAEASFRITGTSLGLKTISFSRSGQAALLYSGLPLSSPIVVERSFMRNTFQVAFLNHAQQKKKYMFSVDDPVLRHNWTANLKHYADIANANAAQEPPPSRFRRAAEEIAFRVLQETLISYEDSEWDKAVRSLSASPAPLSAPGSSSQLAVNQNGNGSAQPSAALSPRRSRLEGGSSHVRSKSRSQIYHRSGPGMVEQQQLDMLLAASPTPDEVMDQEVQIENVARLWSGKELEMVCTQNSLVALALERVGAGADEVREDGSQLYLRSQVAVS